MRKMSKVAVKSIGVASIAALLILSACAKKSTTANPGAGGSTGSSGSVTVSTKSVSGLGDVLVDSKGMTLYYDKAESGGSIMCTGSCASAWPPLLLPSGVSAATAGSGVDASKLGSVARPDGTMQVTYAGMPLYLFASDTSAGQATGQGVAGFYVVTASGGGSGAGSGSGASGSTGGGGYHY